MENEIVLSVRELIVCILAFPFYFGIYKLIMKGIDVVMDLIQKHKNKKKEEIKENV